MKPPKVTIVILVAVVFMGCNKVWMIPPGNTQMDFERDKAQCRYEAQIYTRPSHAYVPSLPKDKYGISGGIATGLAQGLEEAASFISLFNACMNARGYFLVDKPQPVADIKPIPNAPEKPIISPPASYSLGTTKIFTWDFSVAYSGPGDNYPAIATFRKGEKLTIVEQSGKWVKVRSENNQVGWIRSEVLE